MIPDAFISDDDGIWILPHTNTIMLDGTPMRLCNGAKPTQTKALCCRYTKTDFEPMVPVAAPSNRYACGCISPRCMLKNTNGTCKSYDIRAFLNHDSVHCTNPTVAATALLQAASVTPGAWDEPAIRGFLATYGLQMPPLDKLQEEDVLRDARAIQHIVLSIMPDEKFPWLPKHQDTS